MKKISLTILALMFVSAISRAQMTALQLKGNDCNGNYHDLFADLDAGKAVIMHFFMPSCGSCPPPAQKIQKMANNLLKTYPGKITGYAMPFQNSTTCTYTASWVSSNGLSFYAPMDSGAAHVANYGGFGMPTVVVLGGKDHKVLFSTLDFATSDTTIMKNKIVTLLSSSSGISDIKTLVSNVSIFPNPAKNKVQLELNLSQSSNLKVEVLNIVGDVISVSYDGKVTPGIFNQEINTESIINGIYMIRIIADGSSSTHKIVVAH